MASALRYAMSRVLSVLLVLGSVLPAMAGLAASLVQAASPAAWATLLATPGLWRSLTLSLWTGTASTLLSLILAHLAVSAAGIARRTGRLRSFVLPMIALPHLAVGIGLVLLLSPSGLLLRMFSPWLTGYSRPPDWIVVQDPQGLALILGLVVKETPFLALTLLGALTQVPTERFLDVGRTLGYGPLKSWLVAVAPPLQRQIRLPTVATLVYGCTNVDLALPLGPQTPPPMAILLWQWFTSSRIEDAGFAHAGTVLLVGAVVVCLAAVLAIACALRPLMTRWATDGHRFTHDGPPRALGMAGSSIVGVLAMGAVVALLLRASTPMWRFPAVWPVSATGHPNGFASLADPLTALRTAAIGIVVASATLAIVWSLSEWAPCKAGRSRTLTAVFFLPLLMPQISFLFGLSWLASALRLDGSYALVAWTHLGFALPYGWGVLSTARAALDERYLQVAASLGAGPFRRWCSVTLPLLARPSLLAASLAFAVSTALYLPTLAAGAGHVRTLAVEAAALTSAGTLHVAAQSGIAMALLPLLAFAIAAISSRVLFRRFGGMPR